MIPLDSPIFKFLSPSEMLAVLAIDESVSKNAAARTKAESARARCILCIDTGMDGAIFCSCEKGATLAHQAYR